MAFAPCTLPLLFMRPLEKRIRMSSLLWSTTIGLTKLTLPLAWHLTTSTQFSSLWELLQHINLQDGVDYSIVWKLTTNSCYPVAFAYRAQFARITSTVHPIAWKPWAPPKYKLFTWLISQTSRVWTADRLAHQDVLTVVLVIFASVSQR